MREASYQQRKDQIFGIVVNEYVKNVTPVSSHFIVQEYHLDLSTASIRKILFDLEADGLLTHPHTSAGRVPTSEGYRYFVDHLMREIQLLGEEKLRIRNEYEKDVQDLEHALERANQVIAELTHYTSIISLDEWGQRIIYHGTSNIIGYPELQQVNEIRRILQALEEKKKLLEIINRDLEKKINIYIGHEISSLDIQGCSMAVSGFKTPDGHCGRVAVLGPTCMDYTRVVSALNYLSEILNEIYSR